MTKQGSSGRAMRKKPTHAPRKTQAMTFADDTGLADEIALAAVRKADEAAATKRASLSTDEFVKRLAPRLLQDMAGKSLREIALAVTDAIDDAVRFGKLSGRTPKPSTIERSLANARKAMPKAMSDLEIDAAIERIARALGYRRMPDGPNEVVAWLQSARSRAGRAGTRKDEVISTIDELLAFLAPSSAHTASSS